MEPNTPRTRRIAAHYLYSPRGWLRNGILSLDAAGCITDISTSPRVDALAGVEFYNGVLVPGLVNAHCHLELSCLRGAIAPGCGFSGFARGMREHRNRFSPEEQDAAARYWAARMRAEGTVLTADICNTDITFVDKAENPDAWHNFLELYGLRTRSLDPLRPLVLLAYAGELDWSITPHATYSLGRDAFAMAVGGLGGDDGDVLSIHFMESEAERELFQRRGNLWTWYREQDFPVDFLDYGSPAERILAQVPADRNLMLIHNTFVTAGEIEALQAHFGDRLTWVLCPRSNRYITGAQPPAELLRRHGARIALGTDSLASNTDLSLIEEMKMFPDVPLDELLGWVTTNGARALGRDDRLGAFEVGKSPGVVLLEGIDWDRMALLPAASARRLA